MHRFINSTLRAFYLCLTFVIVACARYPSDVVQALKLAGDNRAELEKVLEHYSTRKEDKLKLKAAYFLIANIPYHYAVHNEMVDSFRIYLDENEPNKASWVNFRSDFKRQNEKDQIKPDLQFITSEYLIRNIDFSFAVWQETPWGKYYSFDVFCEEILPYRVSHEPLAYWKEEYYAYFRPIVDSMAHHNMQPEEICFHLLKYINKQGWTWPWDFNVDGFGASILLHKNMSS